MDCPKCGAISNPEGAIKCYRCGYNLLTGYVEQPSDGRTPKQPASTPRTGVLRTLLLGGFGVCLATVLGWIGSTIVLVLNEEMHGNEPVLKVLLFFVLALMFVHALTSAFGLSVLLNRPNGSRWWTHGVVGFVAGAALAGSFVMIAVFNSPKLSVSLALDLLIAWPFLLLGTNAPQSQSGAHLLLWCFMYFSPLWVPPICGAAALTFAILKKKSF